MFKCDKCNKVFSDGKTQLVIGPKKRLIKKYLCPYCGSDGIYFIEDFVCRADAVEYLRSLNSIRKRLKDAYENI